MNARYTLRFFIVSITTTALAVLFLCPTQSKAQGLYNASNIFINETAIYVDGDVMNSGRIENDGVFAFTRDWHSEGKYKGNGVLQANGHTSQKINHYDQKVNTLVVEGWGTKYIKGIITITSTLRLSTGIVEIASDNVLKLNDGAVALGGSPDSYVDGPLTAEGTGYKFFPIGKRGTYAPIEFLEVQGDAPEFTVEVFDDAPTLSVGDVIVRNGLYWQRTDIKGGFGGSPVAIDFERSFFEEPENITLLAGTDWKEPFATISDLEYSNETDKISTRSALNAPIIMLGEISGRWKEADFYLSTALSPNASRTENHNVKIFGDRLADDQFQFQVFNRFGVMVYQSTSLENMKSQGWDGRGANGVELTTGIYPYRLTALDKTGSKFEKAGVITIVH